MLQYLRAERIVPPYQTRGYKLVELVRIYEVGTAAAGLMRRVRSRPTLITCATSLRPVRPCATA